MADGDQNQQPPRYWFPYWTGTPQRPTPVRPQVSRRLSPPAAPSSPRRPSPSNPRQPTAPPTRGAAPPSPTPTPTPTPPRAAQGQASPSPSRASPLVPIREPPPPPHSNSNAEPAKSPPKPIALPATPKPKDVDVVPPAAAETKHKHGKAAEHKPHHHKEADKEKKDEHKSKEKKHLADAVEEGKHGKEREKEKEKEKEHHAHAVEEGKHGKEKESKALHGQIKAGVADMVHRASGSSGSGHGHPAASVITLAGENKGASMKVGGGKTTDGWKEHHGGHRLDGGAVDGEKKKQGMMTALINSNVQVINNSLLLHSSCSGGDPGVHLKLSAESTTKDKQKHTDKAAAAKK